MDLQGTPIGKSTTGTKVSTDPSSYKPRQEGPGPITNDSLAAESVRQGGTFAQNPDSQPLGVSGGQSTFNNTDTSGATTLSSVPQSGDRENLNRQERYPEALGGQGDYPGAHLPESGYAGGPTRAKKELGISTHQYNTQERQAAVAGGSTHNSGTAPSYVTPVTQNLGNTKPHGTNIREGGFVDSNRKNASFTSEIGSNKDPGRLAENKIQRTNAESGANAACPNPTVDSNQPYAVLGSDQQA